MNPVRVLHVIDTYRIGGPGKTIINSAKFISSRFEIHVAAFVSGDDARDEFKRAVENAGIPFLPLAERGRFDTGRHVAELRAYVREQGISVVHTHGYRSDAVGYAATRWMRGVRAVTTHHGWIRNGRRQEVMFRFAIALAARFDAVACVSEKLLDELPRSLVRSGRASVIHNAIVLQDYAEGGRRVEVRRRLGLGDDDILIGAIGRLSVEKGVDILLRAFARVAAAVPNARLAYVGEGPLGAALERGIAEAKLGERVFMLGHWQPVQPFYEAADIIVCPSLTEGLSNVLLESLALHRPVVATRAGGNAEIVEDRVSGLLVPIADEHALAAAIVDVASDAQLRQVLVRNGYRRVLNEFSFEARMRKEEALYDRLLNGGGSGRTTRVGLNADAVEGR
jgi:glycosyltransferase involved in cell wall biosynthesis